VPHRVRAYGPATLALDVARITIGDSVWLGGGVIVIRQLA
jgi:acetyltransferase-like isoleucine patch superfamily enzyme